MSPTKPDPAGLTRRLEAWVRNRDPDELALGLPLLIALIYLARLGQTFQERLTVVGGDSDAISPLFIAATIDEVPDADIHMAGFGHYLTLGYTRATEWLPFYREVWEITPVALWIASVALVVWAAWRTYGKWAAVLTGVLGLCVSPNLLYLLFSSSHHTWTLYASAIAIALVVFLTGQTRSGARVWIVAGAAALVLGGALASDRLVLLGAIGPLVLAGAGVAVRHPTSQGRMVGLVTGAVAIGAIAIAAGVTQVMEASGFVTFPRAEGWAEADQFVPHAGTYLEETFRMLNGHFFGQPLSIESTLAFATALGVVAALTAPFIVLRRRLHSPRSASTPLDLGRSAYAFFWAATMAIVPFAAIATDQDAGAGMRYLLPVLFAAAATLPLLARSVAARYVVVAGVSIYAVLGVLNIDVRGQWTPGADPNDDLQSSAARIAIQANELTSIADRERAHIGYAGYWEAAAASWSTRMRVRVFPIDHDSDAADRVPRPNAFFVHGGWYVPRADVRSFLIGPTPEEDESYERPPGLGPPVSTHRLLSGAHLYVYPYDIASRLPPVPH